MRDRLGQPIQAGDYILYAKSRRGGSLADLLFMYVQEVRGHNMQVRKWVDSLGEDKAPVVYISNPQNAVVIPTIDVPNRFKSLINFE